ncbi:hypothetical protein LOK49_LG02G01232 [Camellia lanceoleosa]|uniref:Uncharacterized protein n=1 Tax=Camellia lanceoleosa TaxID=1840588 RepID=A0ACC0IJK5_9ERIC|nr:hypothetical protein LOK49_LG02G01232 [Camellia lanceoleosa]
MCCGGGGLRKGSTVEMEVELAMGTTVGKGGAGEIAGIAEEGTAGVGGRRKEGERVRWVSRVVERASCEEALVVEEELALPAHEHSADSGEVAAEAVGVGALGNLVETQVVGVAEMLEIHLSLSLSL